MNKLYILAIPFLPACATVGKMLPGGEEQAEEVGTSILDHAPQLAEQAGTITALMTGNPEMGTAVAAVLAGAAGLFAAKKHKAKKAAAEAEEWEVIEEEEETVA